MSELLPVVLTSEDFALLQTMSEQVTEPFSGATEIVRRKLSSATVVFPADIGADVVTLNSRVRFSVNNGQVDERTLIGGPGQQNSELTLLLTTPRGLALIGATAGQTVTALRHDGWVERIDIESVPYQPEAQRSRPGLRVVSRQSASETASPPPSVRPIRRIPAFFGDDDPGPSAA